ncbi:uncharacterized protein LOC112873266 [Panicum hallii]|uniref:uncharacterized protein LOC112873266 n=1 Tax=Panicum hallii TaxID=206008 RepID=UPI000DF4CF00|nr:uncharacterized protein LOC112873266 [Panicum hallii]
MGGRVVAGPISAEEGSVGGRTGLPWPARPGEAATQGLAGAARDKRATAVARPCSGADGARGGEGTDREERIDGQRWPERRRQFGSVQPEQEESLGGALEKVCVLFFLESKREDIDSRHSLTGPSVHMDQDIWLFIERAQIRSAINGPSSSYNIGPAS